MLRLMGGSYPCIMAKAKIWMPSETHCDSRIRLRVGEEVALKVSYDGARLYMPMWGPSTTVHGLLVGIEWHEVTGAFGDGPVVYGPGVIDPDGNRITFIGGFRTVY